MIAPLLVGALGALTERYGLRTVHKYGHVAELLFTFGLFYLIEEIVHLIWGRAPVDYRIPEALDFTAFTIFSTQLSRLPRVHDGWCRWACCWACTWC